ncbi:unnamed protein product [Rangifer tarandus platyrhynchus]|uniref:Uncharacterized protein n=2 Tax=Rangifer tarandus platyrhynchus TaxID=3082113 RepID=A0AC59Y1E2_RANTA|nr:unnamed protein product [Rangifer tarandus platyrhynchus]
MVTCLQAVLFPWTMGRYLVSPSSWRTWSPSLYREWDRKTITSLHHIGPEKGQRLFLLRACFRGQDGLTLPHTALLHPRCHFLQGPCMRKEKRPSPQAEADPSHST